MKKKSLDKDLFKRVKKDQPNKAFDISEKSSRQLDRSETAEFVASQQRVVNTLGEESELAENWDRFSNTPKHPEEDPKKRQRRMTVRNDRTKPGAGQARMTGSKATHPGAVALGGDATNTSISAKQGQASLQGKGPKGASQDVLKGDERKGPDGPGEAQLEGGKAAAAQSAQLEGEETIARKAGMAGLEGRKESGPGQAWLEGGDADPQAGYASLQGEDKPDPKAGYASLDGQDDFAPDATAMANDGYQDPQAGFAQLQGDEVVDPQAGHASLEGSQPAGPGHASLQGKQAVDPEAGYASLEGSGPRGPGSASLQGDESGDPQAGQASLQGGAEREASQDQLQGMSQEEWDKLHQAGHASLEGSDEAQAGNASLAGGDEAQAGHASLQGSAQAQAGNSSLEGRPDYMDRAGQASMQSAEPKTRQQVLMEAKEKMRRHKADANLQGSEYVEQNVALQGKEAKDPKVGQATLEGRGQQGPDQAQLKAEEHVERLQGQAILEGKLDTQDQVKLKGKLEKSISRVQLDGKKAPKPVTKKAPEAPAPVAQAEPEKPKSRLASRLAQKMSKIREQSADITKESVELQHRNADD